jgi:hypothetical protein
MYSTIVERGRLIKHRVVAVPWKSHLHRGVDRRGVSPLGNFVAEPPVLDRGASARQSTHRSASADADRLEGAIVFRERGRYLRQACCSLVSS